MIECLLLEGPRGILNTSLVGKISFRIPSPQALVAVFTDGSGKAGLGNGKPAPKPPGGFGKSSGISCTSCERNSCLVVAELATVYIAGDLS